MFDICERMEGEVVGAGTASRPLPTHRILISTNACPSRRGWSSRRKNLFLDLLGISLQESEPSPVLGRCGEHTHWFTDLLPEALSFTKKNNMHFIVRLWKMLSNRLCFAKYLLRKMYPQNIFSKAHYYVFLCMWIFLLRWTQKHFANRFITCVVCSSQLK